MVIERIFLRRASDSNFIFFLFLHLPAVDFPSALWLYHLFFFFPACYVVAPDVLPFLVLVVYELCMDVVALFIKRDERLFRR
jgi:hypothetical protein